MPEARATLEAGGLLPAGTATPDDLPTDTVDARGYVHPSIAGRVVVRLVPDAIARGIDTEMELLGFSLGQHADDIAIQRRRALGFPGATLVEDPERARYALDVMREFKRHAKRITSKPGHAKEGFDEIASRLQRQVPHFLPSYWEEVARAFANGGNLTYAAQSFDKARTAEREFGLTVDEERRGEAFLEFALLGALTVKSLQSYGKELSQTAGPKPAYERMFSLATRRTLGGIPPWASMPKDLRTLVKAAKLDAKAEEERLLRELLSASSLKRAPASFWNEYRDSLVALGKADPAVRAKLLDLFPNGGKARWAWNRDESGFSDTWMGVLADAGALDVLWDANAPADALPSGGRVAWLERMQEWSHFGEGWALQIVRKAAPLLREGPPVKVLGGDYYKPLDIDLVDLLIELGIPWTLSSGARVDLAKWATGQPCEARAGLEAEVRPRDPVHAAADPNMVAHLGPAVDAVFGNASFEAVAAGMRGLSDLRRRWLLDRIGDLDRTGLSTATLALNRLEAATSADHFAEFPDAVDPLANASIARSLARTLALGIFEELRWPAWEQARKTLGLDMRDNVHVHRQFPHLLLANDRKLLVLGRDGVELEHDLKHGHGDNLPNNTLFVGGSALVVWSYWNQGSKNLGYWSHAPNDTWECQGTWSRGQAYPIEHADTVIYGETRVSRGDRVAHPPHAVQQAWDATGAWVGVDQEIRAQDRQTGARGEPARPAFLAEAHWSPSDWCYVPVDAPNSPLGVVEGQYGWRWVRPGTATDADEAYDDEDEALTELTLVTLAGDRRVGQIQVGQATQMPTAMVRWPGADRPRPVAEASQYWRRQHAVDIFVGDPDVPQVALSRMDGAQLSVGLLPPVAYWHFLVPTDPAGSQRLRKVDEDDAARLIAAARAAGDDAEALSKAIAEILPEVREDHLRAGVAHVVKHAAGLEERVEKLREARKGGKVHRTPDETADLQDEALLPSVANLRRYWMWGAYPSALTAARTLGRFLTEGETGETIVHSRLDVMSWLGSIRAVAWCAARSGPTDADRRTFARFARGWAGSGLAEAGTWRIGKMDMETVEPWVCCQEGKKVPVASWRHEETGRRLFVWNMDTGDEGPWHGDFVERGPLADWPGTRLHDMRTWSAEGDAAWLERFADLLVERGARTPNPALMERLAEACGISRTEAALLLEGMPEELDKATREAYGLKHAEVKAVAPRLWGLGVDVKLALLGALAGDDPASVWEPDIDALSAAWVARFGKSVPVDEALLTLAAKELTGRNGGQLVKWFANPSQWAALVTDAAWTLNDQGVPQAEGSAFNASTAREVVEGAAWLSARLPVGHALRAGIPAVVAHARKRVASPQLWVHGINAYLYEDKIMKAATVWFDALPTAVEVVTKNDDGTDGFKRKTLGTVVVTMGGWRMNVAWQPSKLDPSARELIDSAARLLGDDTRALNTFDTLVSEPFEALLARLGDTPVHDGGWEQDPSRSAPAVVEAVVEAEGLSSDAAVLWLQLMALLDPTKKACIEWNGWSPKTYAAATAELVERGLVVEGKRARAGREHFLPGGWVEAKDILPYEEWKRPLYGWNAATDRFPIGNPVALEPLHRLFERAWQRCVAGDRPRFEEVRR